MHSGPRRGRLPAVARDPTGEVEGMSSDLEKPIVIIGAACSGTHLMASLLRLHHDVAYLAEPNYIWKYANAWLGHDMIPSWRATPAVRTYVRNRFAQFCRAEGKPRLCEKTPANSIRLGFVMQVLPEAKVVHLVRDGRDVVASVRNKIYGDTAKISRRGAMAPTSDETPRPLNVSRLSFLLRRARQRLEVGVPARDFVLYLPGFINTALNIVGLRRHYLWGPRLPGHKQLSRTLKDVEVAAIQWRTSIESTRNYIANHPELDAIEVRYEELCAEPVKVMKRIYEFCELAFTAEVEEGIRAICAHSSRISTLKLAMSREDERLVDDHIAHVRALLGYANSHSTAHAA